MSTLAIKMAVLRSLHTTWAPNEQAAQAELFYYGARAIAGDY
jgi:hypothetical protein